MLSLVTPSDVPVHTDKSTLCEYTIYSKPNKYMISLVEIAFHVYSVLKYIKNSVVVIIFFWIIRITYITINI